MLSTKVRPSLSEQIKHVAAQDTVTRATLFKRLSKSQKTERLGFRWHAVASQKQQDRKLEVYEDFCRAVDILPARGEDAELSEKEKDMLMFPANHNQLYEQLGAYIEFVAIYARGQHSQHICYTTLSQYCWTMVWWAQRYHRLQTPSLPPIPRSELMATMTESLRWTAQKHNLNIHGRLNRTQLGLAELRQLLDFDASISPNIALAEGHQLAWCIGRICSVRPGSLGWSHAEKLEKNLYLQWRDIQITRGHSKGFFQVFITFRSLKTNYTAPDKQVKKGDYKSTLRCNVVGATKVENLIFSVPHRLLVIALRRRMLVGIDSLEELLNGELHHIEIKEEYLNQAVIRSSGPRGLSLSDSPANAGHLTSYLQIRGKKMGYENPINFYSIRRRAATDMARMIGNDAARALMNHDPDSRILEKYYLDLESVRDLSGLALGEPTGAGGFSSSLIEENHSLAINVLTKQAADKVHGPALNALSRQVMNNDPDYPVGACLTDLRNYRRRVRNAAVWVLLSKEVQEQRRAMSQLEYGKRVAALTESKLMQMVLDRARAAMKNKQQINDQDSDGLDPETGDLLDAEIPEPHEEDLEDQVDARVGEVTRHTDEAESGPAGEDLEELYPEAVEAFMQVLLDGSFSQHHDFKNNPVVCPLCEEDESVDAEKASKTYASESHLNDHMEAYFHVPKARWMRMEQINHDQSGEDKWRCSYCQAEGVSNLYATLKALMVHIENSGLDNSASEHNRLKTLDGWYAEGWAENTSERHKKRVAQEHSKRVLAKSRRMFGVNYGKEIELPSSRPHPTTPGVVLGGPWEWKSFAGGVACEISTSNLNTSIAARHEGVIRRGNLYQDSVIPDYFRDVITIDEEIKAVPLQKFLNAVAPSIQSSRFEDSGLMMVDGDEDGDSGLVMEDEYEDEDMDGDED